jgi:nucleoside-diphosphate-sugar epimerase
VSADRLVAVTGSAGFIGAHVVRALLLDPTTDVLKIDRADRERPRELLTIIPHDLTGVESVIHCAAHADVRGNWEPGQMDAIVRDNGYALRALLDACAAVGTVRSFAFISTGAVYADQLSPYAASKLSGEAWCKAYAAKFGWRLNVVRPAACYGSGYHHGHIADFVKQAKESGRIRALTDGYVRDGLHVEDLAEYLVGLTDPTGPSRTRYVRSSRRWGCRDMAKLMHVGADWSSERSGWLGDVGCPDVASGETEEMDRPLGGGVREALASLGWPQ